jgi:hypothetical protein
VCSGGRERKSGSVMLFLLGVGGDGLVWFSLISVGLTGGLRLRSIGVETTRYKSFGWGEGFIYHEMWDILEDVSRPVSHF